MADTKATKVARRLVGAFELVQHQCAHVARLVRVRVRVRVRVWARVRLRLRPRLGLRLGDWLRLRA